MVINPPTIGTTLKKSGACFAASASTGAAKSSVMSR
jgi:hypothetical protein